MIDMIFLTLFVLGFVNISFCIVCTPEPGQPVNKPIGKPRGVKPGRVAWNWDRNACSWDGKTDFWWNPEYLNETAVKEMLDDTIKSLTGDKSSKTAWDSLFRYFNVKKIGKDIGYTAGEKIAIKVNLNAAINYKPNFGCNSVSPQFFKAVIHQLVNIAGVREEDITAFDPSRWFQTQYWNPPTGIGKEFPNVNLVDGVGGESYVKQAEPDFSVPLFFSNHSVDSWNLTRLPKCLTEAKYVIEINAFRGHTLAGITETGKNWVGSVWHPTLPCKFSGEYSNWCPIFLHPWINVTGLILHMGGTWMDKRPMSVYNPLTDLIGHDHTSSKGLLFLADGSYGGLAQGPTTVEVTAEPVKFIMKPFSGSWTCSMFASQDPIGMDSVLFDFLRSEKKQVYPLSGCADNYLHESAMANDPPSKTLYAPSGKKLDSLGVHEHWNNADEMKYSRNLGIGDGIELIKVFEN